MEEEEYYSIKDCIGFINLALVIANGQGKEKIELPKDAAIEILAYLRVLESMGS